MSFRIHDLMIPVFLPEKDLSAMELSGPKSNPEYYGEVQD